MKLTINSLVIDQPSIDDRPEFYAPWHLRLGEGEIGPRRLLLLKAIDVTGSISQAAKSAGMTYKAAWDAVEAINHLAQEMIVERQHGGFGGGGASLTAKGKQLLDTHERLQAMQAMWMASIADLDAQVVPIMRRLRLMTSARNAFYGTVVAIKSSEVEAQVILALQGEDKLSVTITQVSVQRLRLVVGSRVWALIKSTWVVLMEPQQAINSSADNCLCGRVKNWLDEGMNCEVTLALTGGNTITSVMTSDSARSLAITGDKALCALIDSSHIILGVDTEC